VCSTPTIVTSGHGIILMLPANMGIKTASASVLELESSGNMVPIQYLTGSLLNDNIIFYKKSA
jgi:hypothetical protein